MNAEWQARLAAMVRGFHADMAAPAAGAARTRIHNLKAEIAAVLADADTPLSAAGIVDEVQRRHGPVANPESIRSQIYNLFGSCRIAARPAPGRSATRYLYSFRAPAE
jgi:hypothetical protein